MPVCRKISTMQASFPSIASAVVAGSGKYNFDVLDIMFKVAQLVKVCMSKNVSF